MVRQRNMAVHISIESTLYINLFFHHFSTFILISHETKCTRDHVNLIESKQRHIIIGAIAMAPHTTVMVSLSRLLKDSIEWGRTQRLVI